jgi:hypothetical protein
MTYMKITYDYLEYEVEHDEIRAIRRSKINEFLHCNGLMGYAFFSLSDIKRSVRILERGHYGTELKAYK